MESGGIFSSCLLKPSEVKQMPKSTFCSNHDHVLRRFGFVDREQVQEIYQQSKKDGKDE